MTYVQFIRRTTTLAPCAWIVAVATLAILGFPVGALAGEGGLSPAGAQVFLNENLVFYKPASLDNFAWAVASGDFNGDGADDLATGIPLDDGLTGFEIPDCGAVVVRFGIPGAGLATGRATTFLNQIVGGSPDPAEKGDNFGWALAACDFNHDGFDDLAIGVPNEDFKQVEDEDSGAVDIYYGGRSGLSFAAALHLTQATQGMPGDPEFSDHFGFSLACGDFDRDHFDDLAIGIPQETFDFDAIRAGSTAVVHGSPGGLDPQRSLSLNQDSDGADGDPETFDRFGWSLAVGDFDGDGFDDLAVGVVGENNSSEDAQGEGAVQVFFGSFAGADEVDDVLFTEDELHGLAEAGDQLGWALSAGDFDGDDFDDLAIGVPFKDANIGGAVDGGQVLVIYGEPDSFDLGRTQVWTQDILPGTEFTDSNDSFGFALASGDFDADGREDLAIGHPGERCTHGTIERFGAATVVMGTSAGLGFQRELTLRQGSEGVTGTGPHYLLEFGRSFASGDFDADGVEDLAIGEPFDFARGGIWGAGGEIVVYGSRPDSQ